MSAYDDILDLPHYVSKKRPQMTMLDRAAQFSPFAALTGYDAAIIETGRLTEEKIDLDEEALAQLNMKIQLLKDKLEQEPEATIVYFEPDERKSGGAYMRKVGIVKKVNDFERLLIMTDGTKIPMDDILDMDSEAFLALQ